MPSPDVMREAISGGDESSLATRLTRQDCWNPSETYQRSGRTHQRKVNYESAAKALAITEFIYVGMSGDSLGCSSMKE